MLDTLYENIGGKIKNWAKWMFIIEAIGAIISGFVLLIVRGFEDGWWALFIIFFGPIVAWGGSWILYAFGELAEDVHAIRRNPSINSIDKNIQLIAEPYAKREAEEKAKREADEERAKREAEEREKRMAEKKSTPNQPQKEKTLADKLEYALRYSTDEGMLAYLNQIEEAAVQEILRSPEKDIRKQVQTLLEQVR